MLGKLFHQVGLQLVNGMVETLQSLFDIRSLSYETWR